MLSLGLGLGLVPPGLVNITGIRRGRQPCHAHKISASLSDYDDVAENRTQHDTSEQFDDQIANAGLLG